ncbi:4'-phosphopantetheinyl transferase superfamily protein [Granulosicoccaceae sp. 1_MG-2023]|nr:4'-phosphopantetheinyl transferase superfamily protein [Granulosicoccaceae sp. 1_MG-2023]
MTALASAARLDADLIASLFPAGVSVCAQRIDDHYDCLHPAEQQCLGKVVQKRRNEFTTGRYCAARALAALGIEDSPVLPGPKREPLWPDGVRGSITHSHELCVAVVSRDPALLSLGIDVETREGISEAVRDAVCVADELAALPDALNCPEVWKLIFSAKESVYKCLFPLRHQWIGFAQASIRFDFAAGRFVPLMDPALGLPDTLQKALQGRFVFSDDYIFTALSCPA